MNDEVVQTSLIGADYISRMIPGTLHPGADVIFEMGVGASGMAGASFDLGLYDIECSLEVRNPSEDRFVLKVDNMLVAETNVFGGGPARIQLFINAAGVVACRVARGANAFTLLTATRGQAETSATVSLVTMGSAARFKSVAVFSTP